MAELSDLERNFIIQAHRYLENPNFLARVTQILGRPLERGIAALPEKTKDLINQATDKALQSALKVALRSLGDQKDTHSFPHDFADSLEQSTSSRLKHGFATGVTGAVGGFFGLPALPLELPLTTTLILRSVARIADDFGANLNDRKVQMDCLFIFAMGTPQDKPQLVNGSQYYSTRLMFSSMTKEALAFMATRTTQDILELITRDTAPILARFLAQVAARFQIVVTDKFVAQAVPFAGAITGSMINILFTDHFNTIAKFHYGVQRLEHIYGEEMIKATYCDSSSDHRR